MGTEWCPHCGGVTSMHEVGCPVVALPDQQRGLYRKYEVRRTDGSSEPGGKHEKCEYFVLDLTHDRHSDAALLAYADSCEKEYPLLADELRQRVYRR